MKPVLDKFFPKNKDKEDDDENFNTGMIRNKIENNNNDKNLTNNQISRKSLVSAKRNSSLNFIQKLNSNHNNNNNNTAEKRKSTIKDFSIEEYGHHHGNKNTKFYNLPANKLKLKYELHSLEEKNEYDIDNTNIITNNQITNIQTKKEYLNKFSLEKINFNFEEYGKYPDDYFKPSVFFFKFLAMKPDWEGKKAKRLKIFIPDTIVMNDIDSNYWIYTDPDGNVIRTEIFSDSDILEKFKSPSEDNNELLALSKIPNYKGHRLEDNFLELLNEDELEKCIFSKNSNTYALQRFVKCRGPKAFVCRSVWKRNKPAYVYILTNKANYHDNANNQSLKFVVNSKMKNSYSPFMASGGKHLEETNVYMTNIVKFIEGHSDVLFEELVGDFVKDEAGIWWFINIKALKVHNIKKFLNDNGDHFNYPNLDYFITRRKGSIQSSHIKTRKFDYETKVRCKFCGINYSLVKLKYNLTPKMILETDRMLKHIGNNITFIERPDLKHTDCSMIYLPFRVCEDCYLLFETMNDIKNYQIEIANYFRNPVDPINFGVEYYVKENKNKNNLKVEESTNNSVINNNVNNSMRSNFNENIPNDNNYLYRILIMFTDLFWNELIPIPSENLYLLFLFLGTWYKVKLGKYYGKLDYFNINFFKMFYIICDENEGFIDYIEKNRHMEIKLGYFEEKNDKNEMDPLNKDIRIEDLDICDNIDEFIEFATVELSLQGLKYGDKYRNTLNGLLFKKEKPHYVGKLRCIIRISKEGREREGKESYKNIDISKYNLRKHFNFFIPPVHFVISDELQDYWLEIVERHKLREIILDSILATINKNKMKFDKQVNKEDVFRSLESLISHYVNKIKISQD